MTDYAGLIERLESGSGADDDLAYDVCLACGYSSPPIPAREYKGDVLTSLDAALAFAEAVGFGPDHDLQFVRSRRYEAMVEAVMHAMYPVASYGSFIDGARIMNGLRALADAMFLPSKEA